MLKKDSRPAPVLRATLLTLLVTGLVVLFARRRWFPKKPPAATEALAAEA